MRQSESFNRQVRRRLIALFVFSALTTFLFVYPHASSTAVGLAPGGALAKNSMNLQRITRSMVPLLTL